MKAKCHWQTQRNIDQRNKIVVPDIVPSNNSHLIIFSNMLMMANIYSIRARKSRLARAEK